ncbi:MAG: beta-ketoacyl-[acyl-carrier-protein] synthase family protein [Planctomycetes bacterium]|nr:beta-ketoacyl-[acyl-carrier-protein] synthase family protein [Planctomycetota bacterium]
MMRVVITGLGIVSPIGNDCESFWSQVTAGKSGIGLISLFDASHFPVKIGGEVKGFSLEKVKQYYPAAHHVRDRKVFLGLAAAWEAIQDAGLATSELQNAVLEVGVGLEEFCLGDLTPYADTLGHPQAAVMSVATDHSNLLQTPLDSTARVLGDHYGFSGGRYVNCSACAAGAQVIGEAWRLLQEGETAIVLAGAADSMLNPLGLGGFSILRVLSDENDQPQRACRPFDATRKGTVLGEGAAFLVMETLERARARGAHIYAEILGYGSSLDAYRVSDPDPNGEGAIRSMALALRSAGLQAGDIDCVNAHGTGTPKNDEVETRAIKEVLGQRAYEIPIHAVKSMTGHMIAASGSVEAAAAVLTLSTGIIPPTINLENPNDQCDLDYVSEGARGFNGNTVLSNSFGFGGQNASLIFGRYDS